MVAIVDYGVGNLFSLVSSFAAIGEEAVATGDPETLLKAERLVLPGVGAFGDAAALLRSTGLAEVVTEAAGKGTPLLGICLGMQLLFDESLEYGRHPGLGLIPGTVKPIAERIPEELKIPHIGWNALRFTAPHPLFRNVEEGSCVYFVHSFYVPETAPDVIATAEYGVNVTAAAARDNVMGCQFHPEKSGSVGMKILRAFCEMEGKA